MNKKKKGFLLTFIMIMLFALTGCGKQQEASDVHGIEDLDGKTIGVQIGTTGDIYVSDYEGDEAGTVIERYNKGNDAISSLKNGKIDCVVIDEQPAKAFVKRNSDLSILEEEFTIEQYAVCIAKDNTELLEDFNAALAEIKEDGTLDKIITHYLSDEDDCYEYITVAYLHGAKEREYIKSPKSTVVCTKEDILMTRTGNTGMVVTDVEGVFHNNFFLIDFDRTKYSKRFLVEYLNLDLIQTEIIKRAGTSTIPDLNHGQFYAISIYEPPVELQNQFEDFVNQVDKSKVVVQKALEETQLLFDSLMQKYFG